jgi:7-keto-8-aminopelargonate synthetase-like enzyme
MQSPTSQIGFVNQLAMRLKEFGVIHLTTDDEPTPSRRFIPIEGKELLNFTSSSYLALETDERLKRAAIEAIENYGIQFYCSRAYMSLHHYEELENLLEQIFGNPVVVATSTTSAHLSTLPTVVDSKDAIILDHQVHTSVQMASKLVKTSGVHVEMIRHNRMDYLENRVKKLSTTHEKIWYMADGVYSMYGDLAPIKDLHDLMDKYEQLHLYIDDAHGMSWAGKNGAGSVLAQAPFHPKMILMTSMGKAFGAQGGVAVFHDREQRNLVRNCGSTLIFTGPLQPPSLGAAVASAKIHLSDEMTCMQQAQRQRIDYFTSKAISLGLPIVSGGESPVFYIGMGKPEVAIRLCQRMKDIGFFTCIATYPSVPYNRAGLRLMPTLYHSFEDIDLLLNTLSEELPVVLEQENCSIEQIYQAFEIEPAAVVA